jgi:hypothetical protein
MPIVHLCTFSSHVGANDLRTEEEVVQIITLFVQHGVEDISPGSPLRFVVEVLIDDISYLARKILLQ